MRRAACAISLCSLVLLGADAPAPEGPATLNGFALSSLRVPRAEIAAGGPRRDGIRSVDAPRFVAPDEATWVKDDTPVLGVEQGGVARAYPVHLLEYHQVVNDEIAGVPLVVTYDPLAGTPLVFGRRVGGRTLAFGVSGLLYNSNFLLYDRQTESLWSQFLGEAVAGSLAGSRLPRWRVRQETFASWRERAPATRVLAPPEPERFAYRVSPFSSYWVENRIPFPVGARDERFHAKELVLGVRVAGRARAYLGSIATRAGGRVEDRFEGRAIVLRYDTDHGVFRFEAPPDVEVTEAYWFAWKAFHPDTEVWNEAGPPGP